MPVVVMAVIACNAAVWFLELLQGRELNEFILTWGFVPLRMMLEGDDPERWLTPLTSMFMHGGWLHIIGNMWFLWIFGDNVEDAFGHVGFLFFYLLCGLSAALLQFALSMNSPIPMVGASGAISGVIGAYACFFPRARVVTLIPIFIFIQFVEVPAVLFVFFWFLFQLISGCATIGLEAAGGVAVWAHIGGFIAGVAAACLWKKRLRRLGREIYPVRDPMMTFRRRQRWTEDE